MPTQIHVALLPQLLPCDWARDKPTAVIIDTLRFTTTACQALAAGAADVTVAAEIEEARMIAASSPQAALLCGERHCHLIEGFDLGNSPLDYSESRVRDKRLVFSTTNGTRAVAAARETQEIVLAGLVNRLRVSRALAGSPTSVAWILCAGTDGEAALEDILAAGAILDGSPDLEPGNDAARLAHTAWQSLTRQQEAGPALTSAIEQLFSLSRGGRNLIESGYAPDVQFAARLDTCDALPRATTQWNQFTI